MCVEGMKMEKLLTFIIPCYNAEKYLDKCISSLIIDQLIDRIEIIVVNDGSTDNTEEIARRYADKYPGSIIIFNKENGGHGSAVNIAVKRASGRYFKVLDSDDWILSENLPKMLEQLEKSDADVIINSFHTVNAVNGRTILYKTGSADVVKVISTDELVEIYPRISACCSIHGLTYKVSTYLKSGCVLSEGVSYDDNEYATLPFSAVDKILLLPFPFYQYRIGNSEQSVSLCNQVRRIGHLIKVMDNMLDYWEANSDMACAAQTYFLNKISQVAVSVFAACLVKNPQKKEGRRLAEKEWDELKNKAPRLASRVHKKYRVLKILNFLHFPGSLYQWASGFRIYKDFRLWWSK
jgi:glycosyltransferase involved in cell wall biosynthesis